MKIYEYEVSRIKKYAKNAKKHPKEQVEAIANCIKKYGFLQPLVLDKNMEIVIGHGRFEAARLLGMETVPCVMADDLDEEQIKALRIADNKLNESDWDFALLSEELAGIINIDMTDLGFNEAELLELQIDDSIDKIPGSENVPEHKEPTVEYGQETQYEGGQEPSSGQEATSPYTASEQTGVEVGKEELAAYAEHAAGMVTKRVIIIYRNDEEEKIIKDLLKVPEEEKLKVIYLASDIK